MLYRRFPGLGHLCAALVAYVVTSAPVCLGVLFAVDFLVDRASVDSLEPHVLTACSRFDGIHYVEITESGYSYDSSQRSSVAFFPAYPLMGRLLARLAGWDTRLALLIVSNLFLLTAFFALSAYTGCTLAGESRRYWLLVLAVFGLWPAGMFFRMTYSESTFLLFTLLLLWGLRRRWRLAVLAILSGLVTGVRPVGLAATAAFSWHILADAERGPITRRLLLAVVCVPVASWGLLAYMAYQNHHFGTPFAFAQTEQHWNFAGSYNAGDKFDSLLAGEPIWATYTADPVRDWRRIDGDVNFLFSMFFWNPILFIATLALVLFGAAKSWLSGPEVILGLGLLAIPSVTRAYEMLMASHARFAAVVVPAYLVLGRILHRAPDWVQWSVLTLLATMLMAWSALFAAGYAFF